MKTLLIIIGILVLSVLVYLGFYNAFYSPKFLVNNEGNETIVYLPVNGKYQQTDSIMRIVFDELYERNGIVITKGFGEHLYNINNEEKKITTIKAGCIVEEKDSATLGKISTSFQIDKLPTGTYIVTDFPLKGRMSIMFGMYRVYSKLNDFCIENGYSTDEPVIEIYDREAKKIHYRRKLVQ